MGRRRRRNDTILSDHSIAQRNTPNRIDIDERLVDLVVIEPHAKRKSASPGRRLIHCGDTPCTFASVVVENMLLGAQWPHWELGRLSGWLAHPGDFW